MLRNWVIIFLLMSTLSVVAQKELVRDPNERIPAINYGGKVELKRFLQNEMLYPEIALNNKIEGKVTLSFIVDNESARPRSIKIVESVSKEIDEEAIRLFDLLMFRPDYFADNHYNTLTIKFSIKAYKKYCKRRGYINIDLNDPNIDYSSKVYQDDELTIKPKPLFEDTLETISRFTYSNLNYPEGTRKLNITGTVKLIFVIEPSGRITNIKERVGVGGGATNEAERILRLIKWEPGSVAGKKVRSMKEFQVSFDLTNDSELKYVPGQL